MSRFIRKAGRGPRVAVATLAAAALCIALTAPPASGFAFLSSRWADGIVNIHLQLGTSGLLSDGSEDWGGSAEAALAAWNQAITKLQFRVVRNSAAAKGDGNGINNVFFANEIYGMAFDDSVVAVTTNWSRRSSRTEGDVIFNSARVWDSYDGPLKRNVMDLRRVALHEFGHVLGLDHPDEHGQRVSAIMNSRVTSLNRLSDDDIAGAQQLYGAAAPPMTIRVSLAFPPRDEALDFRAQLEAKYRDGLRRAATVTSVDHEDDLIWTQEYLRYRVHQCPHAEAVNRVMSQIDGAQASSGCGSVPAGQVLFPPRNEAVQFRIALEAKYRDGLDHAPIATSVDHEGDIVWTQEYLRYRVNGCGHGTAVQSVLVQIDGAAAPPTCR